MDLYVDQYLIKDIYSYMTWDDLRKIDNVFNNVSDIIWKQICDKFCTDTEFKTEFDLYWEGLRADHYRDLFLYFINHNVCLVKERLEHMVPKILWSDRGFLMVSSLYSALALNYACDSMKKDRNFVLHHTILYPNTLKIVDDSLRNDRDFILNLVSQGKLALKHAPNHFKSDQEIVLAAAKHNWEVLGDADSTLRSDRKFMETMIKHNHHTMVFADLSLRSDPDFILNIMQVHPEIIEYASYDLKCNFDWMLKIMKYNPKIVLKHAHYDLKSNPDFLLEFIKLDPGLIEYADHRLRYNRDFLIKAAQFMGYNILKYAASQHHSDRELKSQVFKYEKTSYSSRWLLN